MALTAAMYETNQHHGLAFGRKMASERLLVTALVLLGLTLGLSKDGSVLNGASLLLACAIVCKIYQHALDEDAEAELRRG